MDEIEKALKENYSKDTGFELSPERMDVLYAALEENRKSAAGKRVESSKRPTLNKSNTIAATISGVAAVAFIAIVVLAVFLVPKIEQGYSGVTDITAAYTEIEESQLTDYMDVKLLPEASHGLVFFTAKLYINDDIEVAASVKYDKIFPMLNDLKTTFTITVVFHDSFTYSKDYEHITDAEVKIINDTEVIAVKSEDEFGNTIMYRKFIYGLNTIYFEADGIESDYIDTLLSEILN